MTHELLEVKYELLKTRCAGFFYNISKKEVVISANTIMLFICCEKMLPEKMFFYSPKHGLLFREFYSTKLSRVFATVRQQHFLQRFGSVN
jgi:hypothetical protein